MTWLTASTSMPRAAMSVAISARTWPALKAASARSRWPWLLSPWMAAASTPAPSRYFATRSAPRLVRVKTRARADGAVLEQLREQRALAVGSRRTGSAASTVSTVVADGATRTSTGLISSSAASLPISPGMVAEKNRFCRFLRHAGDDPADRLQEAEVEHLVGLVQHQDLGGGEVGVASRPCGRSGGRGWRPARRRRRPAP